MPAASIIIPVYNRENELRHLLAQLEKQSRRDFEVVVVDDGSSTPVTLPKSANTPPYLLRILRHEKRSGVGKARNTGIAAARADLLVFVDSDGDISDEFWFEKHMALYRQADEMAQRAGKTHYVVHSEVIGISNGYWGHTDTYSNWFGSSMKQPCQIHDRHVPTHNTGVRRDVFTKIGLFDETLEVCEDVEWSFRCLDNDIGLFFIPGAPIGHFDRCGFKNVWNHYYRFGLYALSVREKHPRSSYQWLFPKGPLSALALFLPLTALMTTYITWYWLPRGPKVLLYVPGLYLANIANYAGLAQSVLKKRRRTRQG